MKLQALDHPKTLDFAARLNVSRPTAIGHLELFWHFVAKHAPRGNIGKFPDGAIARACDWLGEPEEFLKSLLKSGFLDGSDEHRYLVHDWPEHCPNWVRAQLQKLKQSFYVVDSHSRTPSYDGTKEGSLSPSTRARVSKGRVPKGDQGIPNQGEPDDAGDAVDNSASSPPAAERNGNPERNISGKSDPPEEPSPRRGESAERRNGDFEAINEGVSKLVRDGGFVAADTRGLARALRCSVRQVEVAIEQLRDRGQLPQVTA
jgi:hypothetical protein